MFEDNPDSIITASDNAIGYYSGANGRYRASKILSEIPGIDGIITAASMYENTAVSLNILQKGFNSRPLKPVLNLTFDGNKNNNDKTKIDSFIYYL
jgi:hypothetical protein